MGHGNGKNGIKYVSTKLCGYMRTTYSKVSLSCSSCMIINTKSNSCKDHRQQHLWYHQLDFIVSWHLEIIVRHEPNRLSSHY